ncbi:MAG: hypothetical protein ACJAUG_003747 [Halioglobus sp.]|jgi:hypothetical protein
MIRFVNIAIVVWGLVVQPLMAAAMPTQMMQNSDSTHLSMSADMVMPAHTDGHHKDSSLAMENSSKAPCHEKSPDGSSLEKCDNCGNSCSSGLCDSSCTVGNGPAAFQNLSGMLVLKRSIVATSTTESLSHAHPSRIFHPPKHS